MLSMSEPKHSRPQLFVRSKSVLANPRRPVLSQMYSDYAAWIISQSSGRACLDASFAVTPVLPRATSPLAGVGPRRHVSLDKRKPHRLTSPFQFLTVFSYSIVLLYIRKEPSGPYYM